MEQTLPKKYSLVVVRLPFFDKLVGAARVIMDRRALGQTHVTHFHGANSYTVAQMAVWDNGYEGSASIIDIGDKKYHNGFTSAAEVEMKSSKTKNSPWRHFVPLAAANNATGFLKKKPLIYSLPAMMRELPHSADLTDPDMAQVMVWNASLEMFFCSFRPKNRREFIEMFDGSPGYKKLVELWRAKFGMAHEDRPQFDINPDDQQELVNQVGNLNRLYPEAKLRVSQSLDLIPDLTLPGYLYRMFVAGDHPDEIEGKIHWWLSKRKIYEDLLRAAKERPFQTQEFDLPGGITGCIVDVEDYFHSRAFDLLNRRKYPVLVKRMPTGGVFIGVRKNAFKVDRLFRKLTEIDGGSEATPDNPLRWYYEKRWKNVYMLQNQTWSLNEVPKTSLGNNQLVGVVKDNVEPRVRKPRPQVMVGGPAEEQTRTRKNSKRRRRDAQRRSEGRQQHAHSAAAR